MKKQTSKKLKKGLSLFLAVIMVLTCWVWVAPEAKAASSMSYPVTMTFEYSSGSSGGHIYIDYYEVDANGNLTGTTGEYLFINSLNAYKNSSNTVSTSDSRAGATSGNVPGFPYNIRMTVKSSTTYIMKQVKIGGVTVLNGPFTVKNKTVNWKYDGSGNWGSDTSHTNWTAPALTSVRSAPTAQTISVPKTGSASKTFSVSYNDQYGVQWPSTAGTSATLSSNLSGTSVSLSGNTATVTSNIGVFNNAGYNSTTGQIKTILNMTNNNVTASCDVTFQAPKYNAYIKNYAGSTVKTYTNIGYYNQSVTLRDIPSNTAPTQIDGNDNYHQVYEWPANITSAFNITKDTTYTEIKGDVTSGSHSFGDWVQGADSHTRTCSVCGYVHTQGHVKNAGTVTKAETCTEDGVKTYDCIVCGKTAIATDTINKITGHDFSGDIVENVTGENGNHWQKCSRCDVYGWGTTENACANHNWDENSDGVVNSSDATSSKASTCKEKGFETYTCKDCSATFTKTLPLAAHKVTETAKVDVTKICGADGNVAYWTCSVCDRVWTDSALTAEISNADANGNGIPDAAEVKGPDHQFTGPCVSASAGENGTHKRQCVNFTQCKTYSEETPHVWGDPAVTDATCTATGKKVYTCTYCPQTYEETLEKVAHSMTKIDAVVPECGKAGNNEYYYCATCKKYYKDAAGTTETTEAAEKLAALSHKWTAHHDYDELKTPATCQSPAVYFNHCDYCKEQLIGADHNYGEKDTVNGHKFDGAIRKNSDGTHSYKCTVEGCTEYGAAASCTYSEVKTTVPSTCNESGYVIYACPDCGAENQIYNEGYDFTNHVGGEEVKNKKEATCNTNGYTGDTYCLGCRTMIEKGSAVAANPEVHPHENMKVYEAKNSTCQLEGWKQYEYCDACRTYKTEKEMLPVKAHKFTTYVSNGDGTHTAVCDTCKAADGEVATETKACTGGTANCQDKAVCSVCNAAYGEVNADNHKTVKTASKVPSTCQTEGTEPYRYCADCDEAIDEIVKIKKLAHQYGAWTKVDGEDKHIRTCETCDPAVAEEATEEAACNGGVAYCNSLAKCADCKAEYGTTDAANHKSQANTLKDVVAATCQAPGFSGNYRYDCCNVIKEAGVATEQLAHKFDIEVEGSRTAATCIATGSVTYKCSTCVESEGVTAATNVIVLPVDSKNHASDEEIVKNKVAATCESDGNTGDIYHKCCYDENKTEAENRKALIQKGTVIKANGQHVFGDAVAEYMIEEIKEETDENGKVTRTIVLKDTEPTYAEKITYRRADNKWYHKAVCTICSEVKETACATYEHKFNCTDTDICAVCEGLCSLISETKHAEELKEVPGTAATCVAEGAKAYYKCEACKKYFLDKAGKTALVMTDADDDGIYDVLEIATTAHNVDWANGYKKKTEPGYIFYPCINEGCDYEEQVADSGNASCEHVWSEDYRMVDEATCTSHGYEVRYCTVEDCGAINPDTYRKVVALGHDYDANLDGAVTEEDGVILEGDEPTCEEEGLRTYTCQREGCDNTETKKVAALGHDYDTNGDGVVTDEDAEVTETATCKQKGKLTFSCVRGCGESYTKVITKGDHVVGGEVVESVAATCTKPQVDYYACEECGERFAVEVGEVDSANHGNITIVPGKEATCVEDGYEDAEVCADCGTTISGGGFIDHNDVPHHDHDGDGYCDDCKYDVLEGACDCVCHKQHGLMKIIYKILRFFWKLFGIGYSCRCGATHY